MSGNLLKAGCCRAGKETAMHYFIKDNKLHRYPVPKRCDIRLEREVLRDTIPHGVEQCIYCMRRWPEDER
jgi:hypothetical protein